jgi:hypothetical protein
MEYTMGQPLKRPFHNNLEKCTVVNCSQAPEGHERWTLRMLADKMVALDIVDAVSHETVRRT